MTEKVKDPFRTSPPLDCPFFKRKGESGVVCDGFIKGTEVKVRFENAADAEKWLKKVCRNKQKCGFEVCPYYIAKENLC